MVDFAPASTLDDEQLAALFTAVYAGYWHPLEIDATALRRMVATYDLDLDASVVAVDDGLPLAVGMLAVRETEGWVGGMGVIPERRGAGLGTDVTARLLAGARERGLHRVRLEVLEQNAPAIAVYRKLGFLDVRDLAVWRLERAPDAEPTDAADLNGALGELAVVDADAPWQRSPATTARLAELGTELFAVRADGGCAVFWMTQAHAAVQLLAAPTIASASSMLREPFVRGAESVLWLNGPVDGVAADAMRAAGATSLALQHELEWRP